jgi:RHS repeat-associated protein
MQVARAISPQARVGRVGARTDVPPSYAGARYYHSQTGRFTSPDDPGYIDPLNPQTWNLYAYALNNPLRYVDPLGLEPEPLGPPPIPLRPGRSGRPNSWRRNPQNNRWEPREPVRSDGRGGQPHVTWDEDDGWWR